MNIYSALVLMASMFVFQSFAGSAQVTRGKEVYQNLCASCHGQDLKKAGPIGPDMFGTSHEVLEAKVLRGTYPPGYKPKRPTNVMVRMPHVEKDLPALEAYLNAP